MTERLGPLQWLLLASFSTSYGGAVAVRLLGYESALLPVALPALLLCGWAAMGHLVTLDDDFPGGFSNPEGDKSLLLRSVAAMLAKLLALLGLVAIVWS